MPALFNAKASFSIPSRRLFVVSGDIVSGVVKKGMMMNVRMNSSFSLSLPIEGVEFVTKKEGGEVGLTTLCSDADELAMLQGLILAGSRSRSKTRNKRLTNRHRQLGAKPLVSELRRFGMKSRIWTFVALLALLAVCACGRKDIGQYVISLVMKGAPVSSARDVVYESGGLREQVYDVFFRAQPEELKAALAKAGFAQEDWVSETMRRYESFKKLVPVASQSAPVICYRRKEPGKYCLLMCSSDFTWAYAVHVDHGES